MRSNIRVITPADSYDLTTVAAVKSELGVPDNSGDDFLATAITQVSSAIIGYCNRVFAQEAVQETFWMNNAKAEMLCLSRYPISSVSSITVDGTALDLSLLDYDSLTGFAFLIDSSGNPTTWQAMKIVVSYTGGYPAGGVPYQVERACIDVVKARHFSRTRDPLVKSENIAGVLQTDYWVGQIGEQIGGIPTDIAGSLDAFRQYSVG